MNPTYHPHPETLISYASGTLPSGLACVVACHLSMCTECVDEVHWLERLGGVLLSNLDVADAEPKLTERIIAQWSVRRQTRERGDKPVTKVDDSLLPLPLARCVGVNGAKASWKPVGSGVQERSIELPKHSGAIKLLRLSPGQRLPDHYFKLETEVALVLQGACHDSGRIYVRGDIIEREDPPHRPLASGETECVCLIALQGAE